MNQRRTLFATLFLLQTAGGPWAVASSSLPPSSVGPASSQNFSPVRPDRSGGRAPFRSRGEISIPSTLASTLEVYTPASPTRFVFHIQDIHNHVPSQVNLSHLISLLEANASHEGKSLVVAVEGASGEIDWDSVAALPDQRNKELVGAGLLKAGYLFGEEYAAITRGPGKIKLVGIEDAALYESNRAAREDSSDARLRVLREIRKIRRQLEALRDHNFNATLAELEKNRIKVESDLLPLPDYVTFLSEIAPSSIPRYPSIAAFLQTLRLEKEIDYDQVDRERKELVEALIRDVPQQKAEMMVKQAAAFREGRMSALAYYTGLLTGMKNSHPAVRAYVAYLEKAELVSTDAVFNELADLEIRIAQKLLRHPVAATLYAHLRWVEMQQRFFSLTLLPQEWESQKFNDDESIVKKWSEIGSFVSEQATDIGYGYAPLALSDSELKSAVAGGRRFYRLAEQRNQSLMDNFQRVLARFPEDRFVPVFVAGGFHAAGVNKFMRSQRWGYMVLRPQPEVVTAWPQGYEYPVFRTDDQKAARGSMDFLRSPGGLSLRGGAAFVAGLIKSPSHRLPASGWPVNPEVRSSRPEESAVRRSLVWGWNVLKAAFPTLRWFETPVKPRESSYVSSLLPSLAGAVGGNAEEFSGGLRQILSKSTPAQAETSAHIAIDLDSFNMDSLLAQSEALLRLFTSLNAHASRLFVPNAHVVFFSKHPAGEKRLKRLLDTANKSAAGISFSFVATGSEDAKTILTSARVPAANILETNTFVFSMDNRAYENARVVSILGIPHLALATFAYSHYKEAGSVLSQLMQLFEALTPLRMNGNLTDRIMADLIAKISA